MKRTGRGLPKGLEALSRQASTLDRSEGNTESMVAALGSFDHRVSAIEASIRPAQARTQGITMAHDNFDRTIGNSEAILAQFDIVSRVMKHEQTIAHKEHILQSPPITSTSQAKDILGGNWIQRHRKIVQQNANQHKRVAWARILQILTVQATGGTGLSAPSDVSSSGISRNMIKERFKSFNMQFEEIHARQSQWTIPGQELRDNLRLPVSEVLLPAYRSFINHFGSLVQRGKNPHKYIKHSPEALDQLLGLFFQGQ